MSLPFLSISRYRGVVGEMFSSIGPDRWRLLWIFPIAAVPAGIQSLMPYFAKIETDQLVAQHSDFLGIPIGSPVSVFTIILLAIFLASFVERLFNSFDSIFRKFILDRVESRFFLSLVERLRFLEPGKLANTRVRALVMDTVEWGHRGLLTRVFADALADVFAQIVTATGLLATFVLVEWRLVPVIVFAVACDYALGRIRNYVSKKFDIQQTYSPIAERANTMKQRMSQDLHKLLPNHALPFIVRVMREREEFGQHIAREETRGEFLLDAMRYLTNEWATLAMKIIIWYSVFLGTVSLGTMTMTVMAMGSLTSVLMRISWMRNDLRAITDDLEKLRIFYDFTRYDSARTGDLVDISILECRNLKFRYPPLPPVMIERLEFEEAILRREMIGGDAWNRKQQERDLFDIDRIRSEADIEHPLVLDGVSLRVRRGETVAIVGSNGAGKTTLVELLLGAFDRYEGEIYYDGTEGRGMWYHAIADQFSIVDQEPYLMEGFSIRDNLLLGARREIPDSELWETLEAFGMKSIVERQYQGLDTEIGVQSDFSGGQRQLLVLARVFLQDRPVAIFDEGTNQLDAENEARVMRLLLSRRRDRINIFITHRISTIRDVARIYCLERGRIAAVGTSAELLAAGDNAYARFVRIGSGEWSEE